MQPDYLAQRRSQDQVHALVSRVAASLPAETVDLAREMIEANEAPIALDMMSEALVEAGAGYTGDRGRVRSARGQMGSRSRGI